MSQPKVTVLYADGNILQNAGELDGIAALMGTGTSVGLLGVPKIVNSLADAEEQGFTVGAEPDMHRHLQEFYGELGADKELHIMIVPDTMTLAQMLDNTNASGAKKLTINAPGKLRMLAVYRKPAGGYNGGANFMDSDVAAAITTSKVFGEARLAELSPLRMFIEGRVQNPVAANTLTPNTSTNPWAAVVLGGSLNDGSASVGLALGRAVKYAAQIKMGKVANGPLVINQVYIGTALLKDVANLNTLHGNGFMTFSTHPHKAGFFFGFDNMCTTGDYTFLARGRVVDKAAVIAAALYVEQIEDEVETELGTGNIATHVVSDLQNQIEQVINVNMAGQISGVKAVIDPLQDVVGTNKLKVKLRVQPLGYKGEIELEIGLYVAA
jgi:hypothetical protein